MAEPDSLASTDPQALIAHLRGEAAALRAELEETNQGVLALYAELDIQAEQLRQASDLKSRFLSYMSHEFRTPLGSILSIASLLTDELDGPLSPEQHKQVNFVSNAARELSDMVDDLLDLAKIEAGRITISPAWFDMFDLFAALRGMFRPIVDASAVDLIFEEPVGLPRLYTDDKKLGQILRNFISNSLKFTTRGEVRVSVVQGSAGQVPPLVGIVVQDQGIGMTPEQCEHAFERFYRADASGNIPGTGLGLSLVKEIVEIHGGRVELQSSPGTGTKVTLWLKSATAIAPVNQQGHLS